MNVLPLTLPLALELLPNLSARDRAEIGRTQADLERWARERCALPGVAWGLIVRGEVQAIFGVVSHEDVGTVWIAGRLGWTRHVRTVIRVFREVKAAGFRCLQCKAYADNERAQRFAEHLGFERQDVKDNIVHYGMAL